MLCSGRELPLHAAQSAFSPRSGSIIENRTTGRPKRPPSMLKPGRCGRPLKLGSVTKAATTQTTQALPATTVTLLLTLRMTRWSIIAARNCRIRLGPQQSWRGEGPGRAHTLRLNSSTTSKVSRAVCNGKLCSLAHAAYRAIRSLRLNHHKPLLKAAPSRVFAVQLLGNSHC